MVKFEFQKIYEEANDFTMEIDKLITNLLKKYPNFDDKCLIGILMKGCLSHCSNRVEDTLKSIGAYNE